MPNNTPSWEEAIDKILNAFEWHVMALLTTEKLTKKEAKAALSQAVKGLVLASKPASDEFTLPGHDTKTDLGSYQFGVKVGVHQYQANIIKAIDGGK